MKNSPDNKGIVLLLLKNSIVQFVAGILSFLIILKVSNSINYKAIEVALKSLGYGFFCYLTTPFILYWLTYASQGKASFKKLGVTMGLTALYTYIVWDAYFFFRGAIASVLHASS